MVILLNRLKELRARDGLSQTELAKLTGSSRQTISLIERGDYLPSILISMKIAKVFQLPVDDVFSMKEEE